MDDLISRQAALSTIEKMYKMCEGNLSDYHDLLVACFTDLTPARQWIPCSAEMPPTGKDVLVTLVSGIVTDGERWEPQEGKWFLFSGGVNGLDEDVLAWMPLPMPYKEK